MPKNITSGGVSQTAQNYYANVENYGNYQYIKLSQIINNFQAAYVGEGKILPMVLSGDVSFHAHRALQELNYDTLRSEKSLEIEVCPSLRVPMPNDFVNHVKFTWSDSSGIEHVIYPTRHTSNPFAAEQTDGGCTDCGDTSDTYTTGAKGALTEQEIECDTTDVTCAFQTTGLDETTHASLETIKQYLVTGTGSTLYNTETEKQDYMAIWFGLVDDYCLCLKNSGSEDNCGEQLDWDKFFRNGNDTADKNIDASFNVNTQLGNWAGWTNLKDNTASVNRGIAKNGTWDDYTNTVTLSTQSSNTWDKFKGKDSTSSNIDATLLGKRYGLSPEQAQQNGSYFIDYANGTIHFSGGLSGKTVIIKYISDGMANDEDMIVPKLAEEAMYKWIAYGCASARMDVPQGVVQRLKQERFAETRKAKLRLSNIKLEEIAQTMRGKAKFIDH